MTFRDLASYLICIIFYGNINILIITYLKMNKADLSDFDNKWNKYSSLLDDWKLWTLIAWRNVWVINPEVIKSWEYIRCEISGAGWYWGDAWYIDIPSINLLKSINWNKINWPIRVVTSDWKHTIWDYNSLHIQSYVKESHTLKLVWNNADNIVAKIPVVFSSYEDNYIYENHINSMNLSTKQKDELSLERSKVSDKVNEFLNK